MINIYTPAVHASTVTFGSLTVDGLNIAYREAGDPSGSEACPAARLAGIITPVSRADSSARFPFPCHCPRLSRLRE